MLYMYDDYSISGKRAEKRIEETRKFLKADKREFLLSLVS
jgi:hypothetical protein